MQSRKDAQLGVRAGLLEKVVFYLCLEEKNLGNGAGNSKNAEELRM